MNKPILILVVGTSGSGKTHLTHYLKEKHNIPFLVSYTTRPIRDNETDGIDHHFITPDEVPDQSEMLAYTVFGKHQYFTLKSQVEGNAIASYVVDEDGVRFFQERFADHYEIYPVYVRASVGIRLSRGIDQERMNRDEARELLPDETYQQFVDSSYGTFKFQMAIDSMYKSIKHLYNL